ncbi:MAG: helix-hairpin-helix domain-containing protein [Phycisphaerales bacterium]|nr:MAG: helix-hairpin-helix domain-containing protein [Phycisphaerales bacterium]
MNQTRQNGIQSFAFVVSVCAALGLCRGFVSHPGADDPLSSRRGIELDRRINPNKASVESLTRLPGLGPERARAIVEYRDNCGRTPAFKESRDLQNIKGIGPKTVANVEEWIKFE